MSFLCSDAISEMNKELNLVGQRMDDTDYLLFLDRANKFFHTSMKMPTSQRETDLMVYAGCKEYPLPSDFMGLIEPKRPYDEWSPDFGHTTERELVHWPYGRTTAIKFVNETPYLLINEDSLSKIGIQTCDSLTDGGTWAISGDGASLALDEEMMTQGEGSLKFTVTGSGGTTTLTCTGMTTVDISDLLTSGRYFLDLYSPQTNTVAVSSVEFRIGDDASNYYSISATSRHRGDTILNGWGTVSFDPMSKTTTGSPSGTGTDYLQIIITHGTTGINGVYRLDNIYYSKGMYYQIPYYSKYNVKNTGGTYIEAPTATTDTILCPVDFDECYIYKTLEMAAAIRLRDAALANYFRGELEPKVSYLKSKYPRQESRTQTTWYKNANKF